MSDAFAPRFAIEAGFLILLAVGLGLADLRPALIILVMAIGWVIVSLIEWLAWRSRPEVERLYGLAPRPVALEPEPEPGWSADEIVVPVPEALDYPVREELEGPPAAADEPLTTVLPAAEPEAGGEPAPAAGAEPVPEAEERPKRRRVRRRGAAEEPTPPAE